MDDNTPWRRTQMMDKKDDLCPYGRDDLMVLCAVRYCLGRATYVVDDCREWLVSIWPKLSDRVKDLIKRDVEEAFTRDDELRSGSRADSLGKPLGHDMDRKSWESVRELWRE